MSIELILFVCAACLTVSAVVLIYLRNKGGDDISLNKMHDSTYTNLSAPARMFKLLSIDVNPWICILLILMFSLTLSLIAVDIFTFYALFIAPLAALISLIIFYILKEITQFRRRRFDARLPEVIEIMQAASLAGASPQSALKIVAENSNGDIKKEFKFLLLSLEYGATIESATARISTLYDSESTRMLMQVLIARWHMGGNLAELLNSVSKMIRERLSMRLRANGKLSGAKYSAIFMGLAPYLLIPFFLSNDPQWLQIFIDHPMGINALGTAILLQLIGAVWLRKIMRIEL